MSDKIIAIEQQLMKKNDCLIKITELIKNEKGNEIRTFTKIKKRADKTMIICHRSDKKGSFKLEATTINFANDNSHIVFVDDDMNCSWVVNGDTIVFLSIVETKDILFYRALKEEKE